MQIQSSLDPVLLTRQRLSSRPARPSDPVGENVALLALADEMAKRPDNVLNLLCELILQTCRADSAGVSLLHEQTDEFVWPAVAGAWAPFVNWSMPRSASPCGKVLQYDEALIFRDVPAQFPATKQATPDIEEILLAPFHRDDAPIGTVWAVSHDPLREFDAEDRRVLTSFARFAAAAYQTIGAQQELRQSEEFLRFALEAGGMGTWEWDSKTHLIKGDAAHQAWFGMPPQERPMPNEAYWELMDPEEKEGGTKRAQDALDQGRDVQLEVRVFPPNANLRWLAIRGRPHHDGTDSLIGISYDITERKEREQALRDSREMLKSAVELAGLGLYSVEIEDGKSHLTWDDRVRTMWGLSDGTEVTFQVWLDGVHPEDRDRIEATVERAYDPAGEGLYDVQYRVIGADGVERWVATHGETLFKNGKPVSFLGVALDITERKMVEQGLGLVIEMRNSELQEVSATLEAESQAHERVSERLELLQSELSRGLFAALESRQKGSSPRTQRRVAEAARKIADLSPRERDVLEGLVAGEPHKQIAYRLGISARTVELHRTRMLHRLGTPHLADAIRLAVLAELASD